MLHIARAEQAAPRDRLAHQSNHPAIHDDLVPNGEITHGKLLLSRYFGWRNILLAVEGNGFSGG